MFAKRASRETRLYDAAHWLAKALQAEADGDDKAMECYFGYALEAERLAFT